MFPETKSRETSGLEDKKKINWFPKGPDIKCIKSHNRTIIALGAVCYISRQKNNRSEPKQSTRYFNITTQI